MAISASSGHFQTMTIGMTMTLGYANDDDHLIWMWRGLSYHDDHVIWKWRGQQVGPALGPPRPPWDPTSATGLHPLFKLSQLHHHHHRIVMVIIIHKTIIYLYFYQTQVNLGSDLWVRMSVRHSLESETFLRLNWCDSSWWGYQRNTYW